MSSVLAPIRKTLLKRFGKRLQSQVLLSSFTTAQVGGPAEVMIQIDTLAELEQTSQFLWNNDIPMLLLGAGSNLLFSESGFDGVVLLNRAKEIRMLPGANPPQIFAESGANLGTLARKAALAGIAGLEWASTIPGTVGGAVYGNAGAFNGDIKGNLLLAEILQQNIGKRIFSNADLGYSYRSSVLKRQSHQVVILNAVFSGVMDDPTQIQERMHQYSQRRRLSQPPGASMGSMFKNPPGDFAGRLIEAAGLKGTKIGGVQVSEIHANFFVNNDKASAEDIWQLVQLVKTTVDQKFAVQLELEVETIGFNLQPNTQTSLNGKSI